VLGSGVRANVVGCVNRSQVTGQSIFGGLAGSASGGSFGNCLNLGSVRTTGNTSGAVLGEATEAVTINNCFYARSDRTSGAVAGHDVEGAIGVSLSNAQHQRIEALVSAGVTEAQAGGNAEPSWFAEVAAAQHAAGAPSHVAELSNAAGSETRGKEQPLTTEPATTAIQKPEEEKEQEEDEADEKQKAAKLMAEDIGMIYLYDDLRCQKNRENDVDNDSEISVDDDPEIPDLNN
jgi:hypothetical protein